MLKKLDFTKKLFLYFSLTILIILIFSSLILLHYNNVTLKENIESSSIDSLISLQHYLDEDLTSMDQTLKALHASSDFMSLTSSIPKTSTNYFSQHPSENSIAHSLVDPYLTTGNKYSSLIYISRYYDFFSSSNNTFSTKLLTKNELSQMEYLTDALSTNSYQIYYPPHPNPYTSSGEYVYSVVRPIRDMFQIYGVLEFQKSVKDIDNVISTLSLTNMLQFSILNEDGVPLYKHSDTDTFYDQNEELLNEIRNNDKGLYYLDKETLFCYIHSPLTGWIITIEKDISSSLNNIKHSTHIIIVSYIIAFCVILLFLNVLFRTLTKPLITLKNNLKTLEMNQEIHIPKTGNDEITRLTYTIEETLNKLRDQNIKINIMKKSALQAHLEAMEAQLNPHFLYNTLSVIGAYGMESGNFTISKMCSELSSLLRYSINYSQKDVTLENEINNIKTYLYIMKIRHEDSLEYTWDIDECVKDITVPKLILQPIIENCFKHGFIDSVQPWRIHVQIGKEDNNWFASITNNGNTISQREVDELKFTLQYFKEHIECTSNYDTEQNSTGIGLKNTVLRLYIFYKGKEHFEIYTTPENLTTVKIGGPINV